MKIHPIMAALAAAAFAWAMPSAANAGAQDFTIENETGYTILTIHLARTGTDHSDPDDDNWGEDMMGEGQLETAGEQGISFPDETQECAWDLRASFMNGYTPVWKNLNLCGVSRMVIHYNAETKRTWATYQ